MSAYMRNIICVLALFLIIPSVSAIKIERVNVSSMGSEANGGSNNISISGNGRVVVFMSDASNLVPGDTNNNYILDVFVHDRDTGVTERVNVSSEGDQANGRSGANYRETGATAISGNGRFVAFTSLATNLVEGDTNGYRDVFVHDRETKITERVSVSSTGDQINRNNTTALSISADGRFVVFTSDATNLVVGDTNNEVDVFVHDRDTSMTDRVSVSSEGTQANSYSDGTDRSSGTSISADGRFVAFTSNASNLVVNDTNRNLDIFVHDRDTGITERVSVSSAGDQSNKYYTYHPSISADGRFVTFTSNSTNLAKGDTNDHFDIFVHDRDTGTTELVNVSSLGRQANDYSDFASINADGRIVVFVSRASNLVADDTNNTQDVFSHDRATGMTELVNVSANGEKGIYGALLPSISAAGDFIAFLSGSDNLVAGDTNNKGDVFVTEKSLSLIDDALSVTLLPSSGSTPVGEYIRFRAKLTNTTDQTLTDCKADIINPLINRQREFSYYTRPLNVANPVLNDSIDIAPGEIGQFILAVLPRVAMRKQVQFNYTCDSTQAYSIPFSNTIHLVAKTEPLISEDFVVLTNGFPKTQLVIDRSNGKFWTAYTLLVRNTGSQPTSINLSSSSDLTIEPKKIPKPRLCEPVDSANGDWSCQTPRAEQLQVELAGGESKRVRVFVHAFDTIQKLPFKNRIVIEARDQAGEVVAKTSMGISTLN